MQEYVFPPIVSSSFFSDFTVAFFVSASLAERTFFTGFPDSVVSATTALVSSAESRVAVIFVPPVL